MFALHIQVELLVVLDSFVVLGVVHLCNPETEDSPVVVPNCVWRGVG
jgi:hypothetical protein